MAGAAVVVQNPKHGVSSMYTFTFDIRPGNLKLGEQIDIYFPPGFDFLGIGMGTTNFAIIYPVNADRISLECLTADFTNGIIEINNIGNSLIVYI